MKRPERIETIYVVGFHSAICEWKKNIRFKGVLVTDDPELARREAEKYDYNIYEAKVKRARHLMRANRGLV